MTAAHGKGGRDRGGRRPQGRAGRGDTGPAPGLPPEGPDAAALVRGVVQRVRLPSLQARHPPRLVIGLFAFVNGVAAIGVMAATALLTGQPFVFPSLGPTAFLLFSTPLLPAASPRNTLGGHLIGAAAGYGALVVFGLTDDGPALVEGVSWGRVGAAALSLGLTSGLMVWLGVPHPPAGATTLIVSLGILRQSVQLAVLMVAVALLVLQGFLVNRAAGLDYPAWAPRSQAEPLTPARPR